MANFNWEYIMKSKLVLLAVLSVLSLSSFAGNDNANPCGNNGNNCNVGGNGGSGGNATGGSATAYGGSSNTDVRNSSTNLNTNSNSNVGVNTNTSVNGQAQSTENANNSTSNTSVNVAGDNYEARRIPVATAYANAPMPSATCRSGGAIAAQSTVFGISLGGDRAVDTCEINEASRIAFAVGQTDMALEILCQNKWAKKSTQCQAIAVEE
jgi:hypothetical protein